MTLRFYSLNNIPVGHTAVLMWSSCPCIFSPCSPYNWGFALFHHLWRYAFIGDLGDLHSSEMAYYLGPHYSVFLVMVAEMEGRSDVCCCCCTRLMVPRTVWTRRCWGDVCLLPRGALYHWGTDSNKPTKSLLLGMAILGATYVWQMTSEPGMWQKTEKWFLENFIKLKTI